MPRSLNPRHGSLQVWPRVRAKRTFARLRTAKLGNEAKPLSFAGYKVGMTQLTITDNRAHSRTKGEEIIIPVTVLECPPLKVASIRAYKLTADGLQLITEVWGQSDKTLARRLTVPKKASPGVDSLDKIKGDAVQFRLNAHTLPHQLGKAKRTPEVFEITIGGKPEQQLAYAKEMLGKELKLTDFVKEGQQLDTFAVTTGKGFQGPIKRFGVTRVQHKSEKGVRKVANVGPWTGNRSWTVAHAGQMGFHQRFERNKWVVRISEKADELKIAGGFIRYGFPKSTLLYIKGSVQGAPRRLIRFTHASRPNHVMPTRGPTVEHISVRSQQGN